MPTCRDIITYALRQAKVLASGEELSDEEAADGMVALQSLYDLWLSSGMFGRLTDVYASADYEAKERERVTAPSGVAVTIPASVTDDCSGSTRAPWDLSIIETVVDGVRLVKLYDRTAWVDLLDLELSDEAPLASRSAFGLAAALATSGAFLTMFAGQISRETTALARSFTTALSLKLGSTQLRSYVEYG